MAANAVDRLVIVEREIALLERLLPIGVLSMSVGLAAVRLFKFTASSQTHPDRFNVCGSRARCFCE